MGWNCAAIDHGVTIFPNGKIGPCCQIASDYLKPIKELNNPDRFADLKTTNPPRECSSCINDENRNIGSMRSFYNQKQTSASGIQFLDLRNTNLCNLKCRYCGPHFSNQWAIELGNQITLDHQDITQYNSLIVTDSLQHIYFTGGEPFINKDHWSLLHQLISEGKAPNIDLRYNTNLSVLKYKDIDVIEVWRHFKSVDIDVSIDAVGVPLNYIRSGSNWVTIEKNLQSLLAIKNQLNINIRLTPVLSILNIWFIIDLLEFAEQHRLPYIIYVLHGPDYLALNVIPDALKNQALAQVVNMQKFKVPGPMIETLRNLINNNDNQCLFKHTLNHIMLLDSLRDEKLFDLLPFKDLAIDMILRNHEYE